ncbi:hypothetical protein DL93DRAFT_222140 [Clavulina sp. PMI_390]|nr:hypothetical protein DL93DRAFT_222140 [Clavulina sp. PMI_390]
MLGLAQVLGTSTPLPPPPRLIIPFGTTSPFVANPFGMAEALEGTTSPFEGGLPKSLEAQDQAHITMHHHQHPHIISPFWETKAEPTSPVEEARSPFWGLMAAGGGTVGMDHSLTGDSLHPSRPSPPPAQASLRMDHQGGLELHQESLQLNLLHSNSSESIPGTDPMNNNHVHSLPTSVVGMGMDGAGKKKVQPMYHLPSDPTSLTNFNPLSIPTPLRHQQQNATNMLNAGMSTSGSTNTSPNTNTSISPNTPISNGHIPPQQLLDITAHHTLAGRRSLHLRQRSSPSDLNAIANGTANVSGTDPSHLMVSSAAGAGAQGVGMGGQQQQQQQQLADLYLRSQRSSSQLSQPTTTTAGNASEKKPGTPTPAGGMTNGTGTPGASTNHLRREHLLRHPLHINTAGTHGTHTSLANLQHAGGSMTGPALHQHPIISPPIPGSLAYPLSAQQQPLGLDQFSAQAYGMGMLLGPGSAPLLGPGAGDLAWHSLETTPFNFHHPSQPQPQGPTLDLGPVAGLEQQAAAATSSLHPQSSEAARAQAAVAAWAASLPASHPPPQLPDSANSITITTSNSTSSNNSTTSNSAANPHFPSTPPSQSTTHNHSMLPPASVVHASISSTSSHTRDSPSTHGTSSSDSPALAGASANTSMGASGPGLAQGMAAGPNDRAQTAMEGMESPVPTTTGTGLVQNQTQAVEVKSEAMDISNSVGNGSSPPSQQQSARHPGLSLGGLPSWNFATPMNNGALTLQSHHMGLLAGPHSAGLHGPASAPWTQTQFQINQPPYSNEMSMFAPQAFETTPRGDDAWPQRESLPQLGTSNNNGSVGMQMQTSGSGMNPWQKMQAAMMQSGQHLSAPPIPTGLGVNGYFGAGAVPTSSSMTPAHSAFGTGAALEVPTFFPGMDHQHQSPSRPQSRHQRQSSNTSQYSTSALTPTQPTTSSASSQEQLPPPGTAVAPSNKNGTDTVPVARSGSATSSVPSPLSYQTMAQSGTASSQSPSAGHPQAASLQTPRQSPPLQQQQQDQTMQEMEPAAQFPSGSDNALYALDLSIPNNMNEPSHPPTFASLGLYGSNTAIPAAATMHSGEWNWAAPEPETFLSTASSVQSLSTVDGGAGDAMLNFEWMGPMTTPSVIHASQSMLLEPGQQHQSMFSLHQGNSRPPSQLSGNPLRHPGAGPLPHLPLSSLPDPSQQTLFPNIAPAQSLHQHQQKQMRALQDFQLRLPPTRTRRNVSQPSGMGSGSRTPQARPRPDRTVSAMQPSSQAQPPHQQQLHNRIASAIHRPLQMVRQPSPLRHQSPPDDRDGPGASPLNPSSAHTPSSSHSSTALREGGRMDDHLGVPMAASPPPHDLQLGGSSEEAFTLSGLQHDPSRNFGNGSGSMDLEPWQIFANEHNVDPFKSDLE